MAQSLKDADNGGSFLACNHGGKGLKTNRIWKLETILRLYGLNISMAFEVLRAHKYLSKIQFNFSVEHCEGTKTWGRGRGRGREGKGINSMSRMKKDIRRHTQNYNIYSFSCLELLPNINKIINSFGSSVAT